MKKAIIQLQLAVVLAGFTGVFGRLITLNEGLLTWYRLFFAAVILLIIMACTHGLKRITLTGVLKIAFTGLLLGLHWVFFYGSIKYANISLGVVCFSLGSFFTAVLEPLINRTKFSVPELLLSGLTLCGIVLIFGFDATHRTGIVFGTISAILVALFTIFNKRLTKEFETRTITLYQMIGGCLGIGLLMPLYLYISPVHSLLPSPADLGYLLLLSAFCTVLMYLMITQSLRKVSAFTVNLSFNLEPLYSIVWAILIYQENRSFTWAFYTGLTLIIISVVFQMLRIMGQQKEVVVPKTG